MRRFLLLSVVLVKGAAAGKRYVERAEVIGAYRAMAGGGFIFGPDGWATCDEEGARVAITAQGQRVDNRRCFDAGDGRGPPDDLCEACLLVFWLRVLDSGKRKVSAQNVLWLKARTDFTQKQKALAQ